MTCLACRQLPLFEALGTLWCVQDTEKELQQEKERVAELTRRINQMQHTLDDQNRELHFIKDKLIEIHVPGTSYSRPSIDSTCAGLVGTEHVYDAYAM